MPIAGPKYRFAANLIDGAPEDHGIYALWEREELIYLGCAPGPDFTIQRALRRHAAGADGPCTEQATHYGWELCLEPLERRAELLAEFQARFKRLPRCNGSEP